MHVLRQAPRPSPTPGWSRKAQAWEGTDLIYQRSSGFRVQLSRREIIFASAECIVNFGLMIKGMGVGRSDTRCKCAGKPRDPLHDRKFCVNCEKRCLR